MEFPADKREFARKVRGMTTDHAEDQKKLQRLVEEWKRACDREIRGEKAMLSMAPETLIPLLVDESARAVEEVGGLEAWTALSEHEQDTRNKEIMKKISAHLGEECYSALSDDEKHATDLFVRGYCCMHKELNSVKGGNTKMVTFWEAAGLTGPIKLMNHDNAAAAAFGGSSAAQSRAEEVSVGGAVKTTSLAGAIFHHKDDKKGQQDTLRIFFEASSTVGAMVRFPDTSNTRYQSHCEAAAELLVHLPLYMEFLEMSSVHALCRGPESGSGNHLDLGPLHDKLKAHCCRVIEKPSLLLAPDASYELGSLDGKLWERPDAFYAVQRLRSALPHLQGVLVAFFEGALETWERFTVEFAPGGTISQLTEDQRNEAWMKSTNDDNEGGLGSFRVGLRQAPSMTIHQYNARVIYKTNKTREYIKTLKPIDHQFLRERARFIDSSGLEKSQRREQHEEDNRVVGEKRKKDKAKEEKSDAKRAKLNALTVILDVSRLTMDTITVAEIDLQLDWHRQFDTGKVKKIPMKRDLRLKAVKLNALREAVEHHNARPDPPTRVQTSAGDAEDAADSECEAGFDSEQED
ncbi:hypothetical protein A0H81_13053 [Grifola frondosa]|uniref:Uncharacterized protein n=1 Tax=Grifola frondosa TaxID=5627 RepID=A0A1C7LQY6_GRIFR|nr:hypothetical protein A0H81_13053 [Grifola frondosa]